MFRYNEKKDNTSSKSSLDLYPSMFRYNNAQLDGDRLRVTIYIPLCSDITKKVYKEKWTKKRFISLYVQI